MARKKRGRKVSSKAKTAGKARVARGMKARRPKTKARRVVRGRYTGGR